MQTSSSLNKFTMPLSLLVIYGVLPATLIWLYFYFSWAGVGLLLAQCIFPVYGTYISVKKRVETTNQQKSLLLMLVLITCLLSLSALGSFWQNWLPIKLSWLQLLVIYYFVRILPKLQLQQTGLETGNLLPDFVFDDVQGNPVTRRTISDGPILFYFFRGSWCPFCSAQIVSLMDSYKQIQDEGINLAFVSSQPHEEMQTLAREYGVQCNYLVDTDFRFASKYQLIHHNAIPPALSKYGTDTLLPTLLLIDQHNKVLMLERTDNFRLRPEPELVLERIKELGKNAYLENIIQQRTKELRLEKEKSEKVILNILPEHTAIELKETGKTQARYYEQVSLLFSDFVGFTRIASGVKPQILVDSLNAYFVQYDKAVTELGLEKIKTIGDAYMVASGLPTKDPEHVQKLCQLALRMLSIGEKLQQDNPQKGLCVFDIRIGIHSGPVMAGVVGEKKFSYDIWGDTVNLAARMESASEKGRINISQKTRSLLGEQGVVEARGSIAVKNHLPQEMYFLNELNLSSDLESRNDAVTM